MRYFILVIFVLRLYANYESCNMELAGRMEFDQEISDITGFHLLPEDREFAVVGLVGEDAAAFMDITNPQNLFEVGRISGTPSTWRDLKYWDRHVYIGTEALDGVKVVSVDNPDNPILVHTITDFSSSHNLHVDLEGYLYVVGSEDSVGVAEHDIWIYDLSIPEIPQLVGTWDGEYLHDIEVFNNKLYGAAIYSGYFYIIDVSDKTDPITLISYNTGGGEISTHDCAVTDDENYLITADETLGGHIKIWDISNYENINLVSEYLTDPNHTVHNVYVRPGTNLAIISYYVDGTRVLDILDPENPVEVGYFDTSELEVDLLDPSTLYNGNWGTYAYLVSGYIISSDRQNGLFIFNSPISDANMGWSDCILSKENKLIPDSFSFRSIYPNPFNPVTNIDYYVPILSDITLTINNLKGQLVETLYNDIHLHGSYSIQWNASRHPSGIYFVSMDYNGKIYTNKLTLIK